ncbi:MAG: hydrogen gas-evolving membrane-bound hydrogenase subunit E [Traorella sp.]
MSKKISNEKYKKTFSYKFSQWFYGSEDPYVNHVEMKPQKLTYDHDEIVEKRNENHESIVKKVYNLNQNHELGNFDKAYRILSVLFCVVLVGVLLVAVSNLPPFGDPNNPVNNIVAQRYIENGLQETGAINIVTGMILDYRAFDTLGESHVLFIATCTVLILLRNDKKIYNLENQYETKKDIILQYTAKVLVPPIVIFGIYIILAGHLGPGGGFSGGAIIGAALILYVNAFGSKDIRRFFNQKTYQISSVTALACYSLSKCYSFYTGANHLESIIPLGTPGALISSGLILVLNICVGIVVAGTMYTFYVMFRRGGY